MNIRIIDGFLKKIIWFKNRFMVMSIREIFYRIWKNGYFFFKVRKSNHCNHIDMIKCMNMEFPLFNEFSTNEKKQLIHTSNGILADRIKIFNKDIQLPKDYDFLTDPLTLKKWPLIKFNKIDYRNSKTPGDPKIIWEINRHQYLVTLALSYKLTGDLKYADFVLETMVKWIRHNPQWMGINWVSSMEIGIRLVSWSISLNLIGKQFCHSYHNMNEICYSVFQQTDFIRHNLSLFSSGNNHLIGELVGILAGATFIHMKLSNLYINETLKMLESQINIQFYQDGVNREQSVNYQCHTMEYYALAQYYLKINKMKFSQYTDEMMKKSCNFLNMITNENKNDVNFGDEDGGRILPIGHFKTNRIGDTLSIVNAAFNFSKDNHFKIKRDIRTNLLFGANIERKTTSIEPDNSEKPWTILPYGGYGIANTCFYSNGNKIKSKLFFDAASIGMKPLYAHGHADILSFVLELNDMLFLVDPGTYTYYTEDCWRDWFKSTLAHNTISIAGENQLVSKGRFLWGHEPKISLKQIDKYTMSGTHNGYLGKYGITHQRIVKIMNDGYVIHDRLSQLHKKCNIPYKMAIHFHPDVHVKVIENNLFILSREDMSISMHIDSKLTTFVHNGETVPQILGWYSREYYQKEPTTMILAEGILFKDENLFLKFQLNNQERSHL